MRLSGSCKQLGKKTIDFLQAVLAQQLGFICAIFFFNFQPIAWSLWQADIKAALIPECALLLALALLLTALIAAVPSRPLRLLLFWLVFAVSCLCWLGEAFALFTYKALIGAGIITAILETNRQEAYEFYRMYVGWQAILALIAFTAAAYGLHRFFRQRSFVWPRLFAPFIIFLGCCGTIAVYGLYPSYIANHLFDLPAYHIYTSTRTALANMDSFRSLNEKLATDVELTEDKSTIPNIVLILGEATSRHHMQLYGYYLPDTPYLEQLKQQGQIAVFTDCISPHSTTVAVLRELFTFHDYESPKPWYEYPNLLDVMKKAGYKTYWLSNQESSGIWGNVALLFANRCDVHEFTRLRDSHEDFGTLDGALLPLLAQKMQTAAAKNFYVIHLMGGHSLYYERYPYSFAKFNAGDIRGSFSDSQKLVLAQYANAICYNDYIVDSIIKKFAAKNALVIYLPDHGETIYDDGSNFAGHVEENPNRYMLEIPMVIWASSSFKQQYPAKWQQIRAAVDRPYMTDDMIDTILDLADIKTPQYQAKKSIVNAAFAAGRPRLIHGKDYDRQIR